MLKEAVSKIPEEDSNILRDEPKNAFKLEELASSLCEETGVKGEDLKPQSIVPSFREPTNNEYDKYAKNLTRCTHTQVKWDIAGKNRQQKTGIIDPWRFQWTGVNQQL